VPSHLSEGMQLAAFAILKWPGNLPHFWVAVSTAAELVLGRSPNNTTCAEVVGKLAAEF
jgi:hypothetical protein